jgi:transketolase
MRDTLIDIGGVNRQVVVIDCETATATNILRFKDKYPDRFISLGVAEQNALSFAFGAAREGLIPFVILFGAFLTRRACDQIFIQAGYANANIKMIGCYSGLSTPNTGATHQSINDVTIMRSIPNIKVAETCDELELRQVINAAINSEGPIYIRMVRGDIEPYESELISKNNEFAFGKAHVLRDGRDITLIGSGLMVARCIEAAKILDMEGISAEVINCSSIKPLDAKTIIASAKKTKAVITAENHSVIGGMGGAIAEMLSEHFPVIVKRIGIMDHFGESGPLEQLFIKYGLTAQSVIRAAKEVLERQESNHE